MTVVQPSVPPTGVLARLRRRTPSGTVGAGALEYMAVLGVIASLVAALAVIPIAEPARVGVTAAICNFLGGTGCDSPVEAAELPKCETSSDGRTIGASITAFSVKIGREDQYEILRYGDGTARVMTGDVGEIGLEAGAGGGADLQFTDDGGIRGGGRIEGSVTASGGLRLFYDFDDSGEAQDWVDSNRNIFTQGLNFAGGPLADGAEQLWNAVDDGRPTPSAIAYEIGAQAQLSGEGGFGGLASGGASGQASITGVVEQSLVDGTSTFSTNAELSGDAQATLAMFTGNGNAGITSGYTVSFDAQGNPVGLEVQEVKSYEAAIGMNTGDLGLPGGEAIDEVGWDFDIGEWGGENRRTTYLDLTVPENLAAFESNFVVAGPTAIIRPDALFNGSVEELAARVAADGLQVTSAYAVDNGSVGLDLNGSAGFKFGLNIGGDSSSRRLLDAAYNDARVPGGWQTLTTC